MKPRHNLSVEDVWCIVVVVLVVLNHQPKQDHSIHFVVFLSDNLPKKWKMTKDYGWNFWIFSWNSGTNFYKSAIDLFHSEFWTLLFTIQQWEKGPGSFRVYRGWWTTQFCGDYNKLRIPMNQPEKPKVRVLFSWLNFNYFFWKIILKNIVLEMQPEQGMGTKRKPSSALFNKGCDHKTWGSSGDGAGTLWLNSWAKQTNGVSCVGCFLDVSA